MLKYLRFIDETSDKFWQIETKENTHTVTYGKNGTTGQSKSKTFETEEACLKDAEKLIAEKEKKGYSEDGLGEKKVAKSKPVKTSSGEAVDKATIAEAYTELIKEGAVDKLIPFLDKYLSGNTEFIKKEIKKAKRYWLTYTDLTKDPGATANHRSRWGMRGGNQQKRVIELSALATFSLSDTASWSELADYINQPKGHGVDAILNWAKPDWLGDFLLAQFAKNEWLNIDYRHLRLQEERGHIQFTPEVYARSISDYNDYRADVKGGAGNRVDYITTDPTAYQRDVPLLFQYETNIHNNYLHYNYQNTGENRLLWDTIFDKLLEDKKMDRAFFIQNALEIQTKNWNINLKSYFRKFIDRIKLTEDEIIQHQDTFLALLHAEQSAVVNYGLDYLKTVFEHEGFNMDEFLNWMEPVVMRSDMQSGLKSLLIQLDKVAKSKADYRSRFSLLAADIFMVPDLQLHERVAKFLEKYANDKDEILREKLAMYSAQMLGNTKDGLGRLLDSAGKDVDQLLNDVLGEEYQYQPPPIERLTKENEIQFPESWNDILFQVGACIGSKEALDMEIVLYCWATKGDLFPENYKEELEPYLKQLRSGYSESALYGIFSGVFQHIFYHKDKVFTTNQHYYERMKYMSVWTKLLVQFQQLWIDDAKLPLLCLPTHKPFWVHPFTLVERILAYEQKGIAINQLDLAVAINRMPREQTEEAIALAESIQDKQLKALLLFALDSRANWRETIAASAPEDINWKGLWADVARTFYPNESIDMFGSVLKDVPFATTPYRPEYALTPYYYETWNYQTKKKEPVFLGNRLSFNFPSFQKMPDTFIYGLDIFSKGKENGGGYYYYGFLENDVTYSYSVTPQNPEALTLLLTQGFYYSADETAKGADGILKQLMTDYAVFNPATHIYIAASLFTKSKTTRALAGEVLIYNISENKLPIAETARELGRLIGMEYGPVNRVVEVLVTLKDISYKHNDALYKLLHIVFLNVNLNDKMPTNFKKLVELFFDLSVKFSRPLDAESTEAFTAFEKLSALKPVIGKLKKIK